MKSTTAHEDQFNPEPTPQEEEAWREMERRQNAHVEHMLDTPVGQGPVAFARDGALFWYGEPRRGVACDLYIAPTADRAPAVPLLATDHRGMRVNYSGLLKKVRRALSCGIKEPALAEALRQLQEHMRDLGTRWYAGDTAVVDEILQLYCIEHDAREALKGKGDGE